MRFLTRRRAGQNKTRRHCLAKMSIAGLVCASVSAHSVADRAGEDARRYTDKTIRQDRVIPAAFSPHFSFSDYSSGLFFTHVRDIPLDSAVIYGGSLVHGFANWNWGNSNFHFQSEGWFGKDTGSGGTDKLGHAFTGAIFSDFLTDRIRQSSSHPEGAAITGVLLSAGIMVVIEVFDGFSTDHGFSYEDLISDAAGISFSYLRNTVPGLREKVDFRQEYWPEEYEKGIHPFLGYENKKFLMAVKLGGFEELQDTPLRFLELHAGYYARGFSSRARQAGIRKRREPYVGIGINLSELLLGRHRSREHCARTWTRFLFEHFQVPYTYVGTSNTY